MRVKLLIDEDMSPRIAVALCADGFDACHVRDRDMLGATDKRVLERAFAEDRILVTANVDDFVKLAAQTELHAGIILFEDGALSRAEQQQLVRAAVASVQDIDMANRVLFVGACGTMELEDIPPSTKTD